MMWCRRREPMAPPGADYQTQGRLQRSLPRGRIRLHHHPHLPVRPDRLHGVLQRRLQECQGAVAKLGPEGRGGAVSVLQQGDSPGQLRAAHVCAESAAVAGDDPGPRHGENEVMLLLYDTWSEALERFGAAHIFGSRKTYCNSTSESCTSRERSWRSERS